MVPCMELHGISRGVGSGLPPVGSIYFYQREQQKLLMPPRLSTDGFQGLIAHSGLLSRLYFLISVPKSDQKLALFVGNHLILSF